MLPHLGISQNELILVNQPFQSGVKSRKQVKTSQVVYKCQNHIWIQHAKCIQMGTNQA